ncbi:uncharacterized protein BXZ73DRAFT_104532 [Epithele typhae]|uniref:uncharacterized protein n=1 Tax=Epithele typhae TaxID=378194 RepID=UPI0020075169|nr:uncharacterized protein BXZ73DRAFT_104532 [Epithele typhae]KAH9921242.1 hypothetical protein BXZ73DRAFT_104532 [Epithele typhae]
MSSSIVNRLNEDILLAVLSYLPGHDAVQLAYTCKFMYALSCPSCSVTISYEEQYKLHRTAEAICRPGSSCATYLRGLDLDLMSNKDENIKDVADILRTAKNLRSLSLSYVFQHSWTGHPSIVRALTRMKDLRALSYSPVLLDDVLPMVQSIPSSNLADLSLRFDVNWRHEFPPLVSVLKSFPKLVTLTLCSFVPRPTSLDSIQASASSFPSIRHIALKAVSIAATDILYFCPNLDTIELSQDHETHNMQGHTDPRPRWPKVSRRLTVAFHDATRWGTGVIALEFDELQTILVELLERRASPVPHLELAAGEWEFTRDGVTAVDAATSRRLTRLLAALQPRALTLPVHAGFQSTDNKLDGRMWTEVARVLPRLRALTLRRVGRDYWKLPETLPAALARLPLRCLFIDASPMNPSNGRRHSPGPPYKELERVQRLDALPAKLLAALSKMRVLGITGTAALPDAAMDNTQQWILEDLAEWREEHGERNTRWWRVDGQGAERKLVELWREYGEQAQRLVEDAEKYRVADLDAVYMDKCRYNP